MTPHSIVAAGSKAGTARRRVAGMTAAVMIVGGALAATGCQAPAAAGGPDASALPGGALSAALPGGVTVSCASGQQALVRQATVDGRTLTQMACVGSPLPTVTSDIAWAGSVAPAYAAPGAVSTGPVPAVRRIAGSSDEVVYERPVRRVARRSGRPWQKSAVIIGSSAGVGAGVGGLMGGRKGALIGAAIGGGSAAIWDQVTRRQQ